MIGKELAPAIPIVRALAEAKDLLTILDIRDTASSAHHYYKHAQDGGKLANKAKEIQLRAEYKAGEFLRDVPKAQGRRTDIVTSCDDVQTYAELGIERMEAHRWQKIASIPEEEFNKLIKMKLDTGQELTQAGFLRFSTAPKEKGGIERVWVRMFAGLRLAILIMDTLKAVYDSFETTVKGIEFLSRFARHLPDRIGQDLLGIDQKYGEPWVAHGLSIGGYNANPTEDILSAMMYGSIKELGDRDPAVCLEALNFIMHEGGDFKDTVIPIKRVYLEKCRDRYESESSRRNDAVS